MRILLSVPLLLTIACAGTSAARDKSLAPASSLQCGDFLPGVAYRRSGVYPGPDGNQPALRWLKEDTPVCASPTVEGFGFRRVRFADGGTGFVQDEYLML